MIGLGAARLSSWPYEPVVEERGANYGSDDDSRPPEAASSNQEVDESSQLRDAFVDDEQLAYNGYLVSRLYKRVTPDYPADADRPPVPFDVSYAGITRKNADVATFDAGVYQGTGGNGTHFGLFPFLGGPIKQLIVSQDVFRGGTQWIASLVPRFHVIFDGPAWGVGREADDMGIKDLDGDGVYEILVPITAFYDLQDKMSISEIPLPTAIFKYDEKAERYLPANRLFPEYSLRDVAAHSRGVDSTDELFARSRILHVLLDHVYAGEPDEAWTFFERNYSLADKEEFRQRVESILETEPVYKFIYKRR